MKKSFSSTGLFLLLAMLMIFHAAPVPASSQVNWVGQNYQNVILISWDGFDRTTVKELLAQNKLPNLNSLIKEGSLQEIQVKGHETVTKPCHAEMLTGLSAVTTGVISNVEYQPIPEGYTIFERVKQSLGENRINTIMVTGKGDNLGGRGPGEIKVVTPKKTPKNKQPVSAKKKPKASTKAAESARKGEPFYLTKKSLNVFDGAPRVASKVGPLCVKYLDEYKNPLFLAFFHFSDPDSAGHKSGQGSLEYRKAAIECDKQLGKIVGWLKANNLYDKTLIYVMADHGFDLNAKTHSKAPNSWLATNDKTLKHGGFLADVPATILSRFGVDTESLKPKLIGKPLDR